MTVGLLGQQVGVPVLIEVRKTVPLAHVQLLVVVGAPDEAGGIGLLHVLKEGNLSGLLLYEEVVVAVVVNVDPLGTRRVQPSIEGTRNRRPVGPLDRERRRYHPAVVLRICSSLLLLRRSGAPPTGRPQ